MMDSAASSPRKDPVRLGPVLEESVASTSVVLCPPCDTENGHLSWRERWVPFFRGLGLESVLFLYTITFAMRFVVTQQLFITKSCLSAYPDDVCATLSQQNSSVRDTVTRNANIHNLLLVLAEFVPAAVMSVFLSSWCDKHGNRIPLLLNLCGAFVLDAGTIVTVLVFSAPMYVNVILGLLCGMTGGLVCMTAIVESNASRSSREDMRAVKFLVVMSALLVGVQLGQVISGELFSAGGYLPVYCVSVGIVVCSMLVVLVFNAGTSSSTSRLSDMLKDLRMHNFKEGFDAAFGWRPHGLRHRLVLLALSLGVILFNAETGKSISFYFSLRRFHWSVTMYSNMAAGFGALDIVCSGLFIGFCSRVLKLPDLVMAMAGIFSMTAFLVIKGLSREPWMFYMGCAIGSLSSVTPVAILSNVSKLISKDEAGTACTEKWPSTRRFLETTWTASQMPGMLTCPGHPRRVRAHF
ncbi:putative peptidoglycan muropeptide transporter SLC46 isoform X2 [Rhipicephalus microplus]|uniref:putative peptidoglycan muropeptide transporter SLC46 isoform X2 n=1 Tax=Rhipicephalus microplus TaxID=6941 RepID=UPI003F6D0939